MILRLEIFLALLFVLVINSQYVPSFIKNRYGAYGGGSIPDLSGVKTSSINTIPNASYMYRPFYAGASRSKSDGDCIPACENGGKCIATMCLCPTDFAGPQCQFRKDVCDFKRIKFTGGYKCKATSDSVTCSLFCPEGSHFEFTPAYSYICYYSIGQFEPPNIPQCILEDPNARWITGVKTKTVASKPAIKDSRIIRLNTTKVITPSYPKITPKPGICFTWGGNHYKTFDGQVFSFSSKCSHVLVRDSIDNTFEITVKTSENCWKTPPPENCHRQIRIFLQDKHYDLELSEQNTIVFKVADKPATLPIQINGLRISKIGHFVLVYMDSIGAKLKWDGKQLVQVEITEGLWNKTEGLCGKLDGNPNNDLMTKLKRKPKNIFTLASSWKVDNFGDVCSDVPSEKHACSKDKVLALKATTFCKKLLTDKRFSACNKVMDTAILLEACKWDYCACPNQDPTECACEAVNVYVQECQHKTKHLMNWRDPNFCPIHCTDGKVYKHCAPVSDQVTCSVTNIAESPSLIPLEHSGCIEGCFCPDGTVLNETSCIIKDQCPCKLRGKYFNTGETIKKDCNTCTCQSGQWICTELACGARCSIVGDPHYTTFDGKHFDFMGQCSYYLVKTGDASVEAENVACAGSISHSMGFTNNVLSAGAPSCTKSVLIKASGQKIILKQNHDVVVNGQSIYKLPYKVADINIRWFTGTFIQVALPNGIVVWWDGASRVYIDITPDLMDNTKGLCGTYNFNQRDDFLTPENDIEQSPISFGNKWKTKDVCVDLQDIILIPHPCDVNVHLKNATKTYCDLIKSKLFQDCHVYVDPESFYQDCLYDLCSCGDSNIAKCMCPIIAAYNEECTRQGLQIDWRSEIKECGVQCTGGQKYHTCANPCTRTCGDISDSSMCEQRCVEGCQCPEGQALDDNGECVILEQCNCRYNGEEYPPGYKEIRQEFGESQLCTCIYAMWSCSKALPEDLSKYQEPTDLKSRCNATDNFEFVTCKPDNQITCKNMHAPPSATSRACNPGCQCKKGYVLNTDMKICVKPAECPCHHGGKSFNENDKFQIDCNTCVCEKGRWRCSENSCSGECSAWGDSHYKTFDGKHYDFQGQCDYVLAKGSLTASSFDISIQNVPCGSLGTTCSKSVSIRIGAGSEKESLILNKEKTLPDFTTLTHLTVRKRGLFIIVEAPDLGLIVQWDKGTRVYVKLTPKWKGKVKGLCGNFNGDLSDDFQTPSGGFTEASAKIFGDSWKLQSYCPPAIDIEDTCEMNPGRKIFALKKCGILKSPVFSRCHTEVSVDDYFQRCVFDTCACDVGGDCECLCTALAAYTEECNKKGVHIKWRHQGLCPIQCDERCSTYSPCISTCPIETCENLMTQSKLSKSCADDSCVEGCELKPCPSGHVYYNASHLECVPRKDCKTICLEVDSKIYYEGDIMEEDDCHSCYCSRAQKICKGQPCVKDEIIFPEITQEKPEKLVKCKPDWTNWINQNKIFQAAHKTKIIQDDREPLPTVQILNILEDSAACEPKNMTKIQCRTVKSQLNWTETGDDVTCDLKQGLVCKSTKGRACQDYEIRVYCDCAKRPNALIEDLTEASKIDECPPGMEFKECAFPCTQMCQFYLQTLRQKGICLSDHKCESGCVFATGKKPTTCPTNKVWANNETCVQSQDCMCSSKDGKPVKPGTVHEESECEFCQCIDNYYVCDTTACGIKEPEPEPTPVEPPDIEIPRDAITSDEILIPSTVTPPNQCDDKHYINLIDGDVPLSDQAFSSSTIANKYFAPQYARFNSSVSGNSGGSWSPKISTPDEYLQVNLGRLEPVYGIITKGSPVYDEYVTSFKVLYSTDGHKFCYVIDQDQKPQIFRGSLDPTTPIKEMFEIPIEAKIVRVHPKTWHNAIALQIELIGCKETEDLPPVLPTKPQDYPKDPMGPDGMMSDEQITVSSELSPKYNKSHLKIDDDNYWRPLTNSPTEFVQFDFKEPRLVSCVVTKGSPDGWVTSYKVIYSTNGKQWNPILNDAKDEQIFLGNYDGESSKTNCFKRPINTKLIKLVPVTWHKNIVLQTEILGESKPYPVTPLPPQKEKPDLPTTLVKKCNLCPGVPTVGDEEISSCQCYNDTWFDGENCVARAKCSCYVGNNPYPVGGIFENEECEFCVCKLGGVPVCKPKICPTCEPGLRTVVTSTCECSCQPCPEGTTLCPTSDICISTEFWCNGIQDCPDDEKDCLFKLEPEPEGKTILHDDEEEEGPTELPITTEPPCPEFDCPPGFVPKEIKDTQGFVSPMFSTFDKIKTGVKGGYGGIKSGVKGAQKFLFKRPQNNVTETKKTKCPEFECILEKKTIETLESKKECAPISCPPNYIINREPKTTLNECPKYSCTPPPPPEAICNITADTFNTFDDVEYEYSICNHLIARDLINDYWFITLQKSCDKIVCTRALTIHHDENVIISNQDLSITFNGDKYTVDQTKKIGSQTGSFSITRLGDTLLFTSNKHGFWVTWDKKGNVRIGIVRKLLGKVDGMCGFFNENPQDDKRKPDGTLAKTSVIFGDSWGLPEQEKCEMKRCDIVKQNKALEMCNKVKDDTFSECWSKVDVQSFISRCVETTCNCLETTNEEECRCQALQSFVIDCLASNPDLDVAHWRMQHDCPATCETPSLIHHDCYQRTCEPTCETIADPDSCPKVSKVCFPGCYCPPGLVKNGATCIQPSSCRDCECNLLPHLKYITYDLNNFTVDGNCTYLMSRDTVETKKQEHKFEVYITNKKCKNDNTKMCIEKVTVLFNKHKLEIFNNVNKKELKLLVDGKVVNDFGNLTSWIVIQKSATKHLRFNLKSIQVEISVYYPSLGVSIKAPSHKYKGKFEGLCGNCDKDASNDLPKISKKVDENVDKLITTWMKPVDKTKKCENQPVKECEELAPELDPCSQLLDINKFGQCLRILDPGLFKDWCQKDTCGGRPEMSCASIEAFARDCANAGFCINWRTNICPPKTCPPGLIYDPCGPNCPKTCANLKDGFDKDCIEMPVEGCFCPEGKVLLNGTCVLEKDCEVCDEDGHHPGDTWIKDKCTKCSCSIEGKVLCATEQCSGLNKVCDKGFEAIKVPAGDDECCDDYACVPAKLTKTTCETPQKLACGAGQVMKLDTKPNGCQQFICECKPPEDCDKIDLVTEKPLADGFIREIDTKGCCPVEKLVCKKEFCPKPPQCQQYFNLESAAIETECCPQYKCEPPKDRCIYENSYMAHELGGERPRNEFEKQQIAAEMNQTWKDGPCRECKCTKPKSGIPTAICTQTECPTISSSPDYRDYVLETQPVFEQCCPTMKRIACKDENIIYGVGEKWTKDGDYCTTYECKDTVNGLQKETLITNCDETCDLGFEYEPAIKFSKKCCGTCKAIACAVDGALYKIDEEWQSLDHCTNYFCVLVNGTAQVQAFLVNCPKVSDDFTDNFVYETVPVEGECCDHHITTACKDGARVFKVGEAVPSSDGNKCKQILCTTNGKGDITKQTKIETCNKDCAKGFEYLDDPNKCCGECVPVACVLEDEVRAAGDQWKSLDNCTTFTCEKLGDQLTISGQQESCPSIDHCPDEDVYKKGCCKYCNLTASALSSCTPIAVALPKTLGLIKFVHSIHGFCVNKNEINGFMECSGTCQSTTAYNPVIGSHESICDCCRAMKYKPTEIDLICQDGFIWKKKISIPVSCKCQSCTGSHGGGDGVTIKSIKQ